MNLLKTLKFFVLTFFLLNLFGACQNDSALVSENEVMEKLITMNDGEEEVTVKYTNQLDGKAVPIDAFSLEDETLNYHFSLKREENTNEGELIVYAFTTEDKYLQFSDDNGLGLRPWIEAANHLSKYAEETGAIEIAENTGEIPEWYVEYEQNYLTRQSLIGKNEATSRAASNVFRNGCAEGGGPSNFILNFKSFFLFRRWRNSISRFFPLGAVYGADIIYDRSFYRRRIGTIDAWQWQTICLDRFPFQGFNDRAESWIKI